MTVTEKLQILRDRVLKDPGGTGALLVVYPPEDELEFRQRYSDLIREWRAANIDCVELDLSPLPFEVLGERQDLTRLFRLDANPEKAKLQQEIARLVEERLVEDVTRTASEHPGKIVCLQRTAALYPWASYSYLLERCENNIDNTVIIPFPGTENGPELHFLGAKDGYNYRATRV